MNKTLTLLALAAALTATARAQAFLETEYLPASDMNDKQGAPHGRGDLFRLRGRYTLPLSVKTDELLRPTAWTATLSASFARLGNEGEARSLNPDEMLNAGLSLSHTRPLSARWQLIATLGAGVYAAPDEVGWQSVLANGAVIFAYKLSDRFSLGVGMGLTNSYGVPLLMPMGYLSWRTGGHIKVQVDMASGMAARVSTQLGERVGLELTAMEIDGMSAVRRADGKSKIYSTMMMRSSLTPSFRLTKKTRLRLGLGATWLRSTRMSDRSLRDLFKSFSDNEGKYRFRPTMRLSAGVSCEL